MTEAVTTGNLTNNTTHSHEHHEPEVEWFPIGAAIVGYVVFAIYILLTR